MFKYLIIIFIVFYSTSIFAQSGNNLVIAAENCNKSKVQSIINSGISINSKDTNGNFALLFSIKEECDELTIWLINNGADVNLRNSHDASALLIACYVGNRKIISALRNKGAYLKQWEKDKLKEEGISEYGETIEERVQKQLPQWMQQSGWVTFSEVCQSQNDIEDTNNDCGQGSMVTEANTLMGAIHWAGEVIEMYYDKPKGTFTYFKVEITWTSENSNYSCGQIIKKAVDDLKEFTHKSIALRKCETVK